jgi:hypothetical protein
MATDCALLATSGVALESVPRTVNAVVADASGIPENVIVDPVMDLLIHEGIAPVGIVTVTGRVYVPESASVAL